MYGLNTGQFLHMWSERKWEIVFRSFHVGSFERTVSPVPTKIIYSYREYQKEFDELSDIELIEGFPNDLCELTDGHDNSFIVLDDLIGLMF